MFAAFLLAATVSAAGAQPATLYRIDLAGGQTAWAIEKPQPNGSLVLFRHYPDGALMSVHARDVKKIVATDAHREPGKQLKPGEAIEIGPTGSGIAGTSTAPAGRAAAAPGARSDGSALFNPNRPYSPSWDSKLVPGATMGFPNSPNDYVEGKTLAYPPAPAVQAAPGDVPRAPEPHP